MANLTSHAVAWNSLILNNIKTGSKSREPSHMLKKNNIKAYIDKAHEKKIKDLNTIVITIDQKHNDGMYHYQATADIISLKTVQVLFRKNKLSTVTL